MYQPQEQWDWFNKEYPENRDEFPYRPSHCAGCREIGVPRLKDGKPSHMWPNKWPHYESYPPLMDQTKWHWVNCTADEPHEECVEMVLARFDEFSSSLRKSQVST